MQKLFKQYQQAYNKDRILNFKRFLFFLLIIVHIPFYAQKEKVNPNGYNVFYFPNGNISSEGTLRKGKPDGYWKTYYENGELKSEGYRKDFLLDSVWKFYNTFSIIKFPNTI